MSVKLQRARAKRHIIIGQDVTRTISDLPFPAKEAFHITVTERDS